MDARAGNEVARGRFKVVCEWKLWESAWGLSGSGLGLFWGPADLRLRSLGDKA